MLSIAHGKDQDALLRNICEDSIIDISYTRTGSELTTENDVDTGPKTSQEGLECPGSLSEEDQPRREMTFTALVDLLVTNMLKMKNIIQNYWKAIVKKCRPIIDPVVKAFFVILAAIQNYWKATVKKCQPIIDPVVKAFPVILAAIFIIIMGGDQGTDASSTYEICTVSCKCSWDTTYVFSCVSPTYRNLGTFSALENDPCNTKVEVDPNLDLDRENFCFESWKNKTACLNKEWSPKTTRHPWLCLISISAILGPSIINSTYILNRIWQLYPSLLRYLGMSQITRFLTLFKIILVVLYILQLLPYAWLIMIFLINFKYWSGGATEEFEKKTTLDNVSRNTKIVFCILEDTTQLCLHSLYICLSVLGHDAVRAVGNAGVDMLHWGSYLGLASSAFSMALTVTLFKRSSTSKATVFIQFCTTFVSIGTRGLVCGSYAAFVLGPDQKTGASYSQIWTLVLPPVTALFLVLIEHISYFVCRIIKYNVNALKETGLLKHMINHVHYFYEWLTNLTCNECKMIVKKNVHKATTFMIFSSFEADSAQSLVSSGAYLCFAVAMNTIWSTTEEMYDTPVFYSRSITVTLTKTKEILFVLQYLALISFILNFLIVQLTGKFKVRCLTISILFLMSITRFYLWIRTDFSNTIYLFQSWYRKGNQNEYEVALESLTPVFFIAGIIVFVNLFILIISIVKK